jgi:hypothetical protein
VFETTCTGGQTLRLREHYRHQVPEQEDHQILEALRRYTSAPVARRMLVDAKHLAPAGAQTRELLPHLLAAASALLDEDESKDLRIALSDLPTASPWVRSVTIRANRDVRRARMLARTMAIDLKLTQLTILGIVGAVSELGQRIIATGHSGTVRIEAVEPQRSQIRVTSQIHSSDPMKLVEAVTQEGRRGDEVWDSLRNAGGLDAQVDRHGVTLVFELGD